MPVVKVRSSMVGWILMLVVRMSVWKVRVVAVLVVVVVVCGETVRTPGAGLVPVTAGTLTPSHHHTETQHTAHRGTNQQQSLTQSDSPSPR